MLRPKTPLKSSIAILAAASLLAMTGCAGTGAAAEDKTISLIVTETRPYQEPTEIAAKKLKEEGWELKARYVNDIVLPNEAVDRGEYDANFFQHVAYLDQFNTDHDLALEPAFYVRTSPGAVYSLKHKNVDDLPDGATIAIPVDPANAGRALAMLAEAGKIEIKEDVPVVKLAQGHITSNPQKFKFLEVEQQSLGVTLKDVDAGFMFIASAGEANIDEEHQILKESDEIGKPYRIVVAGKSGFAETEKGQALKEAFQSQEVRDWYADFEDGVLETHVMDLDPKTETQSTP